MTFTGRPAPTAEWTKGEQPLTKSPTCSIDSTDGVATVVITNAQRANSGPYTLRVANEHGEDRATVDVKVTDVPDAPGKPTVNQRNADSVQVQ